MNSSEVLPEKQLRKRKLILGEKFM
jgi:hypothetical protein